MNEGYFDGAMPRRVTSPFSTVTPCFSGESRHSEKSSGPPSALSRA